jgi:hypothetical protein
MTRSSAGIGTARNLPPLVVFRPTVRETDDEAALHVHVGAPQIEDLPLAQPAVDGERVDGAERLRRSPEQAREILGRSVARRLANDSRRFGEGGGVPAAEEVPSAGIVVELAHEPAQVAHRLRCEGCRLLAEELLEDPGRDPLEQHRAQALYAYLTKRDGGPSATYSESLERLARRFPLARSKPTYVRRSLEPALEALAAPLPPGGRQFLTSYSFGGARSDARLFVSFARDTPSVRALIFSHLLPQQS